MGDSVRSPTPTKHHLLPADLLHDLRTPLGHVLGYAELLEEQAEEAGHQELLPFIRKIHIAAMHLKTLFDQNFQSIRSEEADRRANPTIPDGRRTSQT